VCSGADVYRVARTAVIGFAGKIGTDSLPK